MFCGVKRVILLSLCCVVLQIPPWRIQFPSWSRAHMENDHRVSTGTIISDVGSSTTYKRSRDGDEKSNEGVFVKASDIRSTRTYTGGKDFDLSIGNGEGDYSTYCAGEENVRADNGGQSKRRRITAFVGNRSVEGGEGGDKDELGGEHGNEGECSNNIDNVVPSSVESKARRLMMLRDAYVSTCASFKASAAQDHEEINFDELARERKEGAILAYSLGLFVFLGTREVVCSGLKIYSDNNAVVICDEGKREVERLKEDKVLAQMFEDNPDYEKKCCNNHIKISKVHVKSVSKMLNDCDKFKMRLRGVSESVIQDKESGQFVKLFTPRLSFEPCVE